MSGLLLVEDELDLREAMEELLVSEGYQVQAVATGEEAVTILESCTLSPGAIITDIGLPGMSGLDLLQWVRRNATAKDIAFICVSASLPPHMEKLVVQQRNVIFIRKPFDIDQFCAAVNSSLSSH